MPAPEEKITEEQASEALQQLLPQGDELEIAKPEEKESEPSTEKTEPVETETTTEEVKTEGAEQVQEDDLESLRARIEQAETKAAESEKRYNERLQAQQQRSAENERILRDRYLRKSTATDKALKILRAARSQEGVAEAEVDRSITELEGTMHPDSANYVAPEPAAAATEDQALVLNTFLNEKAMTSEESEEFGNWIRSQATTAMSPAEQAVAGQSLDGFLRLAHSRWQEGTREKEKETKRNDAVDAAKSVQRTQREAAKAASGSTTAPRKQPASPKAEIDIEKLTKKDVSDLLKQTVLDNR